MVWVKDFQGQYDQFAKDTRLKTLRAICFVGAAAAILNFIIRLLYFKELNTNLVTILVTWFFLMGLGAWLNRPERIGAGAKTINAFCLLFIPLRVFQSGGIYSPVLFLYVFHCSFLASLYGRKAGLKMLYWSLFSVLCFGVAQSAYDLVPQTSFYENAVLNGVNHMMVLLLTALLMVQLAKENSLVASFLRELEEKKNIYRIMKEYTVKTTPVIDKALSTLAKEEKVYDHEALFEVERKLKEIGKAVKALADPVEGQRTQEIKTGGPL